MPSKSYKLFNEALVDVRKLVSAHKAISNGKRGKKGLGYLTRSGVFMLCAAWEIYHEELIREASKEILKTVNEPRNLNLKVQKGIKSYIEAAKHELKMFELANDGWIQIYHQYINKKTNSLNTPKPNNLRDLYLSTIGIQDITIAWSLDNQVILDFVTDRGEIAHRGKHAKYIKIAGLTKYIKKITLSVKEVDEYIMEYLKTNYLEGKQPWYNTY